MEAEALATALLFMTHWPPEYTIRHSKRAKHVSLRIYSGFGLEIVIPERKKKSFDIDKFLNENRDWVEKQAAKFKMALHQDDQNALPDKVKLPAINKTMDIIYRPIESTQCVSYHVDKHKIIFYGAIQGFSTCLPFMGFWLKKQAKINLKKMIDELSRVCELPYRKLSIRAQKTVWGSCTANGDIQLNYKILFLPESLARYILIHELCHTVHLNHSASFWKLVARYVPDFRTQVKLLKEADQFIPRWLL